ncbi:unnamed protein product [Orchesella dallaii]|uniref:Chromo domain-containing protein n=1 Tax=Orchesella dallaii TaxID=48710 RepID=A0ABP1PUG7_9HEXA
MPATPGILGTRSSRSQKDSVIQTDVKTEKGIRQEIESVAMDICKKEDESHDTNESEDDNTEHDNQDNQDNKSSSPVSVIESLISNTSLKENAVVPSRKKAKAVRRLTRRPKAKQSASRASTRGRRNSETSTSTVTSRVSKASSSKGEVDDKKQTTDKSEAENGSSDEDENVYVVERIDGKQTINGVTYYFIKWKGWDVSANTWEPIEHLEGCSELLEAFSKREAEKGNKRRPGPKSRRKDSDDEDEDALSETRKNMKSYGIITEWPQDKVPISVEGVIAVDGVLTYVVKKKARLRNAHIDRTNAILVRADGFRQYYPELVIAFYQGRVLWCDNNDQKSEDEKAAAAAQVSLLAKHRGTQIGNDITEDINNEILMDTEVAKENEFVPTEDASEESIPVGLEQDTQVIPTEEDEVVDINEPSGAGLADDDGVSHPNLSERLITTENDMFGLPEDLEDEVSTDSEGEFEETPTQTSMTSSQPLGNIKPVMLF